MACLTTYTNSAQDYLDSVQEVCCAYDPCFFIPVIQTSAANQVVDFNVTINEAIDVDWGDGTTETLAVGAAPKSHTYATPGTYEVKFKVREYGQLVQNDRLAVLPGLPMPSFLANIVTDIKQWGCAQITGYRTFYRNIKIKNINAIDTPKGLSNMTEMFYIANNLEYINNIENWDTSNVTTLYFTFSQAQKFNQNLNLWNVSNVTNMQGMFSSATLFNQPLNSWNTSNVTNMQGMFGNAKAFNQPLGNWNVTNVTNMLSMFNNAIAFNQPLNSWNVSNVTNMAGMFNAATSFNQPLNSWNVTNVTDMSNMFQSATAFNQPLGNWNIINITSASAFMQNKTAADYSAANLDSTLIGWSTKAVKPNVIISFGSIARTAASNAAYNTLDLAPNNWTFIPVPTVI